MRIHFFNGYSTPVIFSGGLWQDRLWATLSVVKARRLVCQRGAIENEVARKFTSIELVTPAENYSRRAATTRVGKIDTFARSRGLASRRN